MPRSPTPFLSALAALAALASAPARALAEDDAAPEVADGPGPRYEATVSAPARLLDAWPSGDGLTVLTVDAKELQASGARTVQEALRSLPGVALADEQGNAFQHDLAIRGLTASPVTGLPQGLSVFLDGVRLNEPAVEEVNFDLVPLADVERIEIVRGPNAIFGRNTLGGAIHIITRRGGERREAEVELEAGSALHQESRGRASGSAGPFDGYLSVGQSYESGWRAAGAGRVVSALGKVGVRRDDTDATLSYQVQSDRLGEPGSLPLSMLRSDPRQNYTAGDFFRPSLHLVTLNARQRLAPGLSLAANGFFRALDAEQFNSSLLSVDSRLFDRTRSGGATLQLDHKARLGPLKSRLVVGAEATRSSVRVGVREEANAEHAVTEEGLPLPRLSSDVADAQLAVAGFVQEQVRVARGPLSGVAATAALRYDRISHDILDVSPDGFGKGTGQAAYSGWMPAAGLSWAFAPGWLASTSVSRGFRAPAFLEITCANPASPCIGLQAGVAPDTSFTLLRPVRSRALEAGVSGSPLEGVTASVNAFRVDLSDDIYSVSPPSAAGAATPFAVDTTRIIFQNVGATRREGVELAAKLRRGALELDGTYAYTRATFQSAVTLFTPRSADGQESVRPGASLPMVPSHRFDLGARVRARSWLTLSAGVGYVGSQYLRGDEANEARRLAPYALARAGAEARWRSFTASLRATNLFDHRYETFGTFAPNGRLAGRPVETFMTPGPPLRLVAGLRWELG
jgi:iron complex outermembrane receptor protein